MSGLTLRPSGRLVKAIAAAAILLLLALAGWCGYRWLTRYRPHPVPITVVKEGTGEPVDAQGVIEVELMMRQQSHQGPPHKSGKLSLRLELEGESAYPGLLTMARGARVGAVTRTVMTSDKVTGRPPNPVYPQPPVYLEMTILKAFPSTASHAPPEVVPAPSLVDRWKAQLSVWAGGLGSRHLALVGYGLLVYVLASLAGRRFFTKLPDLTPPPVRLLAVPTPPAAGWYHADQVAAAREFFEKLEFRWVENVDIKPHRALRACLLADPDGVGAVIYDHEREGVWVDLMVVTKGMGGFTVSSAAWAAKLEQPPFCKKHILPGKSPARVWEVFQEKICVSEDDWLELTPENFLWELERAYADEMDWRNAQRASEGEAEVVAQAGGPQPIPSTVGIQKALANVGLLKGLRERFREAFPDEDELGCSVDDLAVIHRRLTIDDLIDYISPHVDRPDCEIVGLPEACGGKTPVEAFEALQELLPSELRFCRVGSLDFPLPADFYRPPAGKIPVALFPHREPGA